MLSTLKDLEIGEEPALKLLTEFLTSVGVNLNISWGGGSDGMETGGHCGCFSIIAVAASSEEESIPREERAGAAREN